MRLYLVYLAETDGNCVAMGFPNMNELKDWVAKKKIHSSDYAIIQGNMLKHFSDRQVRRSYGNQ